MCGLFLGITLVIAHLVGLYRKVGDINQHVSKIKENMKGPVKVRVLFFNCYSFANALFKTFLQLQYNDLYKVYHISHIEGPLMKEKGAVSSICTLS